MLEQHLAVNLFGTYAVTQAFLPLLTRSDGAIVNNVSMMAFAPLPLTPAYAISKAAAFNMTQSLRALLAGRGVRVHAVLTGPTDTDMTRGFEIPKASPESVARAIFDGVENEEEDIFPDPLSASLADSWRKRPGQGVRAPVRDARQRNPHRRHDHRHHQPTAHTVKGGPSGSSGTASLGPSTGSLGVLGKRSAHAGKRQCGDSNPGVACGQPEALPQSVRGPERRRRETQRGGDAGHSRRERPSAATAKSKRNRREDRERNDRRVTQTRENRVRGVTGPSAERCRRHSDRACARGDCRDPRATVERDTQREAERDESQTEHDEASRHHDACRRPHRGEIADRVVDRRVPLRHRPRHRPRGHERGRAHHAADSKEPIPSSHIDQ